MENVILSDRQRIWEIERRLRKLYDEIDELEKEQAEIEKEIEN